MTRGKFITLEGGEGGGKTTQAALLADRLRRVGLQCPANPRAGRHAARRGHPRSSSFRQGQEFGPLGEAVLFYAARESHLELAIRPALERGTWVICDRFSNSTRAYQGAAGGLPVSSSKHRPRRRRLDAARPDDHFRSSAGAGAETRRRAKSGKRLNEARRCSRPVRDHEHRFPSKPSRGIPCDRESGARALRGYRCLGDGPARRGQDLGACSGAFRAFSCLFRFPRLLKKREILASSFDKLG